MPVTVNSEMPSNVSETNNIATNTLSFSFTNTSGTMLIVAAQITNASAGASISSCTYNGVAMTARTPIGWHTNGSPTSIIQFFTLASPATGANTVLITASGTVDNILGAAISVTGESGSIGVTNTNFDDAGGASHALTLSGTTSGSLCLFAAGCGASITSRTQTLSSALNHSTSTSGDNQTMDRAAGTGGGITDTWGSGGDVWGSVGIEILASGGGPGAGSDTSLVGVSESSANLIRVNTIEETS